MFAKMVLPHLGGTPAVWNTCMLFYQATLLAGYAYAHVGVRWLGVRRQSMLHLGVGLAAIVSLPIAIPAGWAPPVGSAAIAWLLGVLVVSIGLPFLVLSASSPMLQAWFARTRHPQARDPYFLFAASNLGSMLGLLSYPVLVEPTLRLTEQAWFWGLGYGLLVAAVGGCAWALWRSSGGAPKSRKNEERGEWGGASSAEKRLEAPSWASRLHWLALALVPSSLLLGLTAHLSSDIAAVPLMWVVPLALYLLTFIVSFSRKPILPRWLVLRAQPIVLLGLAATFFVRGTQPTWLLVLLHTVGFFVTCLVCHGELARRRPATYWLTEYYMWMSIGGALGGAFNALVAPVVFSVVIEYPLMYVAACFLMPPLRAKTRRHLIGWADVGLPLGLGVALAVALWGLRVGTAGWTIYARSGLIVVAAVFAFSFRRHAIRFGLGVSAILLAGELFPGHDRTNLYTARSFFGVHRIERTKDEFHMLLHGTTNHGIQSLDPELAHKPQGYYHEQGPIGQMFGALSERLRAARLAVLGLGNGGLTAYGRSGQEWTFYEIDPLVEQIARDERYFLFLRDCPAAVRIVLGDARRSIAQAPDGYFQLIIADAFSSDAIPVHLITREATETYLRKLSAGGVVAFHISNRYLNLEPVMANLAAELRLVALYQYDQRMMQPPEEKLYKLASQWVLLARQSSELGGLSNDARWKRLEGRPGTDVWTDDYSNLVGTLRWR